jgi:hypothetical protein
VREVRSTFITDGIVVLKPGKQNNAKDAPKRYQTAMKPNEETNSPKKKQEKQAPHTNQRTEEGKYLHKRLCTQ